MQKRVLMICLFLSVSISVFSQKVSVSKIDESRSTSDSSFDNKCEIELKISGDEVRKYKFVKIYHLFNVLLRIFYNQVISSPIFKSTLDNISLS